MAVEYRVVWQREPHKYNTGPAWKNRRYSAHYSTREAAERKALRVQGRIAESKGKDRDESMCGCDWNGYREHSEDCQTWGEWEDSVTAEWQPLVSVRIESREVGEWTAS